MNAGQEDEAIPSLPLDPEHVEALWRWSQESDYPYWEHPAVAHLVALCKEHYKQWGA